MTQPILFLDVDGVLNGHQWSTLGNSCTISPPCVEAFNLLLQKADPLIVLSSAWRYMVHGRAMTLDGFAYMLRTHGCGPMVQRIIGVTLPDEVCAHCLTRHPPGKRTVDPTGHYACRRCGKSTTRGDQITAWLAANKVHRYAVVDDCDDGIRAAGHPLVLTDSRAGITRRNALALQKMLFCQRPPTPTP